MFNPNPPASNGRHSSMAPQMNGYTQSKNHSKRASGDAFRPSLLGLPKDPFAAKSWIVNFDSLPLPVPTDPNDFSTRFKHTILVLGTPPLNDLHSFVYSSLLQDSLVLFATHDVTPFSSLLLDPSSNAAKSRGPITRILRIGSPLFQAGGPAQNGGASSLSLAAGGGSDALRLMSLFNRAAQVASSDDLAIPGNIHPSNRVQQLGEHSVTSAFTIPEVIGSSSPASNTLAAGMVRRGLSQENFATPKKTKRQTFSFFRSGSSSDSKSLSNSALQMVGAAPGTGRTFDALVNYLAPSSVVHERILLKQAILVTTLSAPYLSQKSESSENIPPSLLPPKAKRDKRSSVLGIALSKRFTDGSQSSHENSGDARARRRTTLSKSKGESLQHDWNVLHAVKRYPGPSHIVHVIVDDLSPPDKPKGRDKPLPKPPLAASIEQFVLAYAFPIGTTFNSSPSTPAVSGLNTPRKVSPSKSTPMLSRMSQQLPTPPSSSEATPLDKRNLLPNVLVRETETGPYAGLESMLAPGSDPNNGGRPIPYIVNTGVLGGVFSFSYSAEGTHGVQSISVVDLLLAGALDESVAEHLGGKAWLGGVGVKEIVDGLVGKVRPGLEVRHTGAKVVMENIWIGGDAEGVQRALSGNKRESRNRERNDLPPVPPKDDGFIPPPPPAKVSRKPAPMLPPSESLQAAWNDIAPAVVARDQLEERRRQDEAEREQRRRERERQKEIEREAEMARQREFEREREEEMERLRQAEQQRQMEVERERQRQFEIERERQRQMEDERERQRQAVEREKERLRQAEERERKRKAEAERERGRQIEAELERQKQMEVERERQRLRQEKEREAEREVERERARAFERQKERERQRHHRDREREERERDVARDRTRERERDREADRAGRREKSKDHDRYRDYNREDDRGTGLLTPPGSGSDMEVELENGLDSPVRETAGLSAAMVGASKTSQDRERRDRKRSEGAYRHDDGQGESRRPELHRGYSEGAPTSPGKSRRPDLNRGYSEGNTVPPSESFDIVPLYEYDRSKCDKREEHRERRSDRNYERGSSREYDRDKGKRREYEPSHRDYHDHERSRDPERHRERERHRDRSRRDKDRERERDVDYARGYMGPPPSRSAYHSRDVRDGEHRSRRGSSSRRRHEYYDDNREKERDRPRSRQQSAPSDPTKEVYYYSLSGEMETR